MLQLESSRKNFSQEQRNMITSLCCYKMPKWICWDKISFTILSYEKKNYRYFTSSSVGVPILLSSAQPETCQAIIHHSVHVRCHCDVALELKLTSYSPTRLPSK